MKSLLFTYALAYGGAVAALFEPYVGLLVYVCFAVIRPALIWPWSVPVGNYSRIVGIALLVGWALKGFGSWRLGRSRGVVFALVGYLAWAVISGTQATEPAIAWGFVDTMAKIVLPC